MMELAQADMMALEGVGDFDAVTCYSDSLCYMADQEAVLRVFEGVHSVLNQGGTFLLTFTPSIKWRKSLQAIATMKTTRILPLSGTPMRGVCTFDCSRIDLLCQR